MHFALILSSLAGLALAYPSYGPPSCKPTTAISDGGFESGTTPSASRPNPWLTRLFIGSATYSLVSPGATINNGGRYAFQASLYPGPFTNGASSLTLTQTMKTCAGQNYSIIADYWFQYGSENNCAIKIDYPYKTIRGSVTTPSNISPPGYWYTTSGTFQAVTNADQFNVVFSCSAGTSNKIGLDNVRIEPFAGNAF
ncbi:MAG: hypothetical protein M1816_003541 [Peltula sp. TS41687]|nr:MAG: hypothetical protein M1816_003541 [Peltula sp. TS41687]